jgi:hypothetical protein
VIAEGSGRNGRSDAGGWKWSGPEVVRTYPSDDVVKRIPLEKGRSGRWVPFTVQLVYRNAQGKVTRTENYSSREYWE